MASDQVRNVTTLEFAINPSLSFESRFKLSLYFIFNKGNKIKGTCGGVVVKALRY